jgi:glycosyltransferase involved in cell wall biosynthesis
VLREDRDLVENLRRRSVELGIAQDVELIGPVSRDEKARFLARCDVFSVPATYGESFGLYLLEAWASGVPCVQPRHGSFPELVEASGAGLLVEPDDPAALAVGLAELLADTPRRAALGERGAASAAERFSGARMARDVAGWLQAFCTPRSRGTPPKVADHRSTR